MRAIRWSLLSGALLLFVLGACAPRSTGTPASGVSNGTGSTPAVNPGGIATEPLVPLNLTGPEMAVGSTWPYVDGTTLVAVPAGSFTMGRGGLDNPEHQVTLSDFWIYSTEVTNQQFARCVAAGLCEPPNATDNPGYAIFADNNNPVTGVTYDQAVSYCTFVHGRLPTEAEWEKTARGPDGNVYPWGDSSPSCDLLNMAGCTGGTTSVISYPPGASYYSALDMEGNTFEWVADWYREDYYANAPAQDPLGPENGQQRSVRSSGFDSGANQTQAASRYFTRPEDHRANLGFRCVVEDPTVFAAQCEQAAYYGQAPGGGSNPGQDIVADCPKIDISQSPGQCDTGKTQVTFSSSAGEQGTSLGINPANDCTSPSGSFPGNKGSVCSVQGTQLKLSATCTYSNLGQAACPVHYNLDSGSGMCVWDGATISGTQCLPGTTYDPVAQCCTMDTSTAEDFPLCKTGSTLVSLGGGQYGCLGNVDAQPDPLKTLTVDLPPACEGGGNGCTLTNVSCNRTCRYGGSLDPNSCRCICSPG